MIRSIHQSHLGMWARCPAQFKRRYIDGQIVPPGVAARIGTGVHKGAEVYNSAKIHGQEEPKSVVVDAAVDGYKKACIDGGVFFAPGELSEAKRQLSEGIDQTASLAGLFHESIAPIINPVAVEEVIILEDEDLPIPWGGIIDWRDANPKNWSDLKTADKTWPQGKADNEIQATLYPRLIESVTGILPTELTYELLVKTKEPKHISIKTTRTNDDWRLLKERARLMLRQIEAGLFPPAEPGHWICSAKWCGYFFSCKHVPAWKKVIPKKGAA
jgi:hypothetical protein